MRPSRRGGGGYAVALLVFSVRLPVKLVGKKCRRWFGIKFCEIQFFFFGGGGGAAGGGGGNLQQIWYLKELTVINLSPLKSLCNMRVGLRTHGY